MNKLEIAIKLLKLINERKIINSKIISDELNVSLRTAQRYLKELSTLPYIVNLDNKGNYELYPDYKLKEAVLNPDVCEILLKTVPEQTNYVTANIAVVSVCGFIDTEVYHTLHVFTKNDDNYIQKFNELKLAISSIITSNNSLQ